MTLGTLFFAITLRLWWCLQCFGHFLECEAFVRASQFHPPNLPKASSADHLLLLDQMHQIRYFFLLLGCLLLDANFRRLLSGGHKLRWVELLCGVEVIGVDIDGAREGVHGYWGIVVLDGWGSVVLREILVFIVEYGLLLLDWVKEMVLDWLLEDFGVERCRFIWLI